MLLDLLASETEADALAVLTKRGLLHDATRWRSLGNMPNNQSVVHAQQPAHGRGVARGGDELRLRVLRQIEICRPTFRHW